MIIYLAGPVTGIPEYNRHEFTKIETVAVILGHQVYNPIRLCVRHVTNPEYTDKPQALWQKCMRTCIAHLMQADAVVMLPNWQQSKGATIERKLAISIGIPVYYSLIELQKEHEGPN